MANLGSNAVDTASEGTSTGTIRWEADKNSITNKGCFSPSIDVGGMLWRIGACESLDKQYLAVFLSQKDSDCKMQSVNVKYEMKLINHTDKDDTITHKGESKFAEDDSLGSN
ncbi:hypothetical protein PENTCL1PPCAC_23771 [Pristionchus entomophagus]|uniref:MATH domain-containing protein n=1 Tax=Pristionchus entomophagus TaxID=358040 RepID=A0AAV5U490_9BILA|nr:hypothetical protein PENTCL1PPCAC_23771 [Pristionchus entomophagus]